MVPQWSVCTSTRSGPSTRFSISSAPMLGFPRARRIARVLRDADARRRLRDGRCTVFCPVPAPGDAQAAGGTCASARGPEGAGELVTPTGAALVRVLSSGYTPAEYTPIKSGFGAGTKDPADRPNALRIILADRPAAASASAKRRGNTRHARDGRRRHDARARGRRRGCLTRSGRARCDVHHGR